MRGSGESEELSAGIIRIPARARVGKRAGSRGRFRLCDPVELPRGIPHRNRLAEPLARREWGRFVVTAGPIVIRLALALALLGAGSCAAEPVAVDATTVGPPGT